ncbi:efflux RND transporter periplasmic adaptor subunit [Micromonospora arborensis]|uniref:efflux RND transporter periplasmic adaptor subunit n=1 Tax=Micromonospora arborensis TaxID=2116518 RepID=UPI003713940A
MGIGLKRRWRTRQARWWAAGAVGVLLLGVAGVRVWSADAGDAPARPVTVAVDRGPVAVEVATSGTVAPATIRSLGFTVAGTVQTVGVRPGSVVTVGQRLATIADADAAEAADAVQDAEDDLAEARAALTKARDTADDPVASCPAGAGSGVRPVAWRSPEATATPSTGTPTASDSPTPRPTASSATPTRTPGRPAPSGTGAPGAPRTPTAPGQGGPRCDGDPERTTGGTDQILTAQRRVNQAEATLGAARQAVAGATITAPMAGTVLTIAGPVGSRVTRGAAFITLADTYSMQVTAKFPEADAGALAVGQSATLSLADRPGQTFPATVVQVDPVGAVDGTMVRYGVVLSFAAAPENLLVGQSAAVTVRTGAVADVLRVPSTAVHDGPDRTGTVQPAGGGPARTVTLGLRGNQYAEITSGLAAGELVLRSW